MLLLLYYEVEDGETTDKGGVILFRQIVELTINPEDLSHTLSNVSHSDSQ